MNLGLEDSDADGGSDLADLSSDHEDADPSFQLVSTLSACCCSADSRLSSAYVQLQKAMWAAKVFKECQPGLARISYLSVCRIHAACNQLRPALHSASAMLPPCMQPGVLLLTTAPFEFPGLMSCLLSRTHERLPHIHPHSPTQLSPAYLWRHTPPTASPEPPNHPPKTPSAAPSGKGAPRACKPPELSPQAALRLRLLHQGPSGRPPADDGWSARLKYLR